MERVEIGDAVLFCGDSLEIVPTIAGVDVVITDPPYAEKTHAGARTGDGSDVLIDFASITDDSAIQLGRLLCATASRWVVMTCDWMHAASLQKAMPDEFIRAGVWVKPNGMPQYTGDRPAMGWEAVAILHRKGRKRWNGGGSHAVWTVPKVHGNHPTEKPVALVSEWVRLFTDPGDVVLDPFAGSGTTGVACAKMGRRFIGIERDRKHFLTACRRIEEAYKQADLFVPAPASKPVQTALFGGEAA